MRSQDGTMTHTQAVTIVAVFGMCITGINLPAAAFSCRHSGLLNSLSCSLANNMIDLRACQHCCICSSWPSQQCSRNMHTAWQILCQARLVKTNKSLALSFKSRQCRGFANNHALLSTCRQQCDTETQCTFVEASMQTCGASESTRQAFIRSIVDDEEIMQRSSRSRQAEVRRLIALTLNRSEAEQILSS